MKTTIKSFGNLFKKTPTRNFSLFPFTKKGNFHTSNKLKNFNQKISPMQNPLKISPTNFINNSVRKNFCETSQNKFSLELLLPNFDKFTMNFDDNSTFKDVANSIQKNFKFENIEFRTWNHSIIALGNDLNSTLVSRKFVFLRIDTFEWQLVNYSNMRENFNEAFDDCKIFIYFFINFLLIFITFVNFLLIFITFVNFLLILFKI